MTLPAPRLDDRTFQQLVDEAKRYIQRQCPQWSDHNVSDPGVTLVETFAWMTDMLLYRLNRVPDHIHRQFLELLGVGLFPPSAARTVVSFRLSSHQDGTVLIPAGTAVSTQRTSTQDAVTFTTISDLEISPASSTLVATTGPGRGLLDRTSVMGIGDGFEAFSRRPVPGDAIYLRLDGPAPSSILLVQVVARVGGHDIDPRNPPLAWEASTPQGWVGCPVERDSTFGLNVSGAVEIHLPADHNDLVVSGTPGAWVRCRVVSDHTGPAYSTSPQVVSVTAATVGGDVEAVHGEPVEREVLGVSDGTPGQRFTVRRPPVLPDTDDPLVLETGGGDAEQPGRPGADGWTQWQVVPDFTDSTEASTHFTIDRTSGQVRFGPLVRQPDGGVTRYGATPPRGAVIRLRSYRTGGGSGGNLTARSLAVLRSSIPYVASVYNRAAALGGVDGESVEEAMVRGPVELRRRGRAVTADDYAAIAREAAPELARVHCVAAEGAGSAAGVRVLVVPQVPDPRGTIALQQLQLPRGARDKVQRALDTARVIGTRVSVEPPSYFGVRVDAVVRSRPGTDADRVKADSLAALYRYFNPLAGGPDGTGWPLGRPVQNGEVFSVLGAVAGVDFVDRVALFQVNLRDNSFGEPIERIDLAPTNLFIGVDHLVLVDAAAA